MSPCEIFVNFDLLLKQVDLNISGGYFRLLWLDIFATPVVLLIVTVVFKFLC